MKQRKAFFIKRNAENESMRTVPDDSAAHEAATADFGEFGEPQRFVKGDGSGRVVGDQLHLAHIRIPGEHRTYQRRGDALPLVRRIHQEILDEDDRGSVADRADEPDELISFICRQSQQGMAEPLLQGIGVIRIGRPADGGLEPEDFLLPVFGVFPDFHILPQKMIDQA